MAQTGIGERGVPGGRSGGRMMLRIIDACIVAMGVGLVYLLWMLYTHW